MKIKIFQKAMSSICIIIFICLIIVNMFLFFIKLKWFINVNPSDLQECELWISRKEAAALNQSHYEDIMRKQQKAYLIDYTKGMLLVFVLGCILVLIVMLCILTCQNPKLLNLVQKVFGSIFFFFFFWIFSLPLLDEVLFISELQNVRANCPSVKELLIMYNQLPCNIHKFTIFQAEIERLWGITWRLGERPEGLIKLIELLKINWEESSLARIFHKLYIPRDIIFEIPDNYEIVKSIPSEQLEQIGEEINKLIRNVDQAVSQIHERNLRQAAYYKAWLEIFNSAECRNFLSEKINTYPVSLARVILFFRYLSTYSLYTNAAKLAADEKTAINELSKLGYFNEEEELLIKLAYSNDIDVAVERMQKIGVFD